MKVVLSQASEADLDGIEAWIGQDNPAAAKRIHARLSQACRELAEMPERFQADTNLRARRRTVGAYVIYYRVTDHVEIIRVLHGARNRDGDLENLD